MIHTPLSAFAPAPVAHRSFEDGSAPASLRVLASGLAALVVAGLHVAIFLALTRSDAAEPLQSATSPAAVMVDLAPVPVAAQPPVDDRPETQPEPVSEETEPPPDVTTPPEIPPSTPPLPDVKPQAVLPSVPRPEPHKPRKTREPLPKAKPPKQVDPVRKPKHPLDPNPTAHIHGGPSTPAQTASRMAASTAGGRASATSLASWQGEVRSRIVRAKRFPPEAHGIIGVAVVRVTFTAGGGASGVRLVASSGSAALDAEAVAVMYRAAPYPPPPDGRASTLTIPLNFHR